MINKFQQGGAAPQQGGGILAQIQSLPQDQLKLIMNAFAQWAQQKGVDIQQLQSNPAALELALGQFMQEILAQQAQMAKHGAKLNYIKKISHKCADDEELVYYKVGGKMGCGCEKKAQGGKAPQKKQSAIKQFKNEWTEKDDKKLSNYHMKGTKNASEKTDSINLQKKWNKLPEKVKKTKEIEEGKCGGKMKKHQIGGTLEQLKNKLGL